MSLKSRLFAKDSRRSSCDLTANLQHAMKKLCKEKPIRLTALKVEYDRYFKDRISSKPPELITAALKSLEQDVVAVKVYMLVDNREMTDLLLGLRSASYSLEMHHEDNPHVSKERLLYIIKESGSVGIHVRDLEKRYLSIYGTRPSYLPYKSIKELLHRTPDVELASSGKNLRVRTRQAQLMMKKTQSNVTKIPSLNRSGGVTSSLRIQKKKPDFMSMSVKLSDSSLRSGSKMSTSVFASSDLSPNESPITSSSGSSPTGSVDMSVSMIQPKNFHWGFGIDKPSKSSPPAKKIANAAAYGKEMMATILNDFPAEGMSLKALTDEFLGILGPGFPLGMTTVEFLTKEFNDVVKIDEDENGLRVFKVNSPLLPRRTIADVYTKLALQSNRKPSDRVLKVLKNIYRKTTSDALSKPCEKHPSPYLPTSLNVLSGPGTGTKRDEKQDAVVQELHQKISSAAGGQSRLPVFKPQFRTRQSIVEGIKSRLQNAPIEYPREFQELTKDLKDDTQSLLVELMSSLNLCLKPQNGKMVLQMS